LFAQAKKGNVSAIGKVLLLGLAVDPPAPGEGDTASKPSAAPAKLGKKEAAQVAAVSAADGTDWAGILPSSGRVQ
jgi:hypothetical protein